ncbi:MAG: hypothetical protein ACJ75R_03905 [Solirubrobacterales bacterium]
MIDVAILRPSDWEFPLFVHVLGAMFLVGSVVLTLIFLVSAWRGNGDALRIALRSMLFGVLPGYIVMRVGAQWVYSKEGYDDLPSDPNWIGIGFGVADFGLLLLIVAAVAAWLARRRGAAGLGVRVATLFIAVLLVADLVAIWAMTTKPA